MRPISLKQAYKRILCPFNSYCHSQCHFFRTISPSLSLTLIRLRFPESQWTRVCFVQLSQCIVGFFPSLSKKCHFVFGEFDSQLAKTTDRSMARHQLIISMTHFQFSWFITPLISSNTALSSIEKTSKETCVFHNTPTISYRNRFDVHAKQDFLKARKKAWQPTHTHEWQEEN